MRSVRVWLNAFIPATGESSTPWPGVPGASIVRGPFGMWFSTDHRGFSSDPAASARLHSELVVGGLDTDQPYVISAEHRVGTSHQVDPSSGTIVGSASADTSRMHFGPMRDSPTVADPIAGVLEIPGHEGHRVVAVDIVAAANNPLLPGAPDIDYKGTLIIDLTVRQVRFVGAFDDFPNYEAYFRVDDCVVETLVQVDNATLGSPEGLFGEAAQHVDVVRSLEHPQHESTADAEKPLSDSRGKLTTPTIDLLDEVVGHADKAAHGPTEPYAKMVSGHGTAMSNLDKLTPFAHTSIAGELYESSSQESLGNNDDGSDDVDGW